MPLNFRTPIMCSWISEVVWGILKCLEALFFGSYFEASYNVSANKIIYRGIYFSAKFSLVRQLLAVLSYDEICFINSLPGLILLQEEQIVKKQGCFDTWASIQEPGSISYTLIKLDRILCSHQNRKTHMIMKWKEEFQCFCSVAVMLGPPVDIHSTKI